MTNEEILEVANNKRIIEEFRLQTAEGQENLKLSLRANAPDSDLQQAAYLYILMLEKDCAFLEKENAKLELELEQME